MGNNDLNSILEVKDSSNIKKDNDSHTNIMSVYEKILRTMANLLLVLGIFSSIVIFITMGLDSLNAHGNISYYFNFNGFLISILTLVGSSITWAFFSRYLQYFYRHKEFK